MPVKKLIVFLGLSVVLLASAFAEGDFMQVQIPFEFFAGKKMCPAGTYIFGDMHNGQLMTIRNAKTGETVMLPTITRIDRRDTALPMRISFAVKDGVHVIEAVSPAYGDGYLLPRTTDGRIQEALAKK